MTRFPSDTFHQNFIDLFPSNDESKRDELKFLLDELSQVPDSFCGAAWFPKTYNFSHLSDQVERVLGHPRERYFELGTLFLHALVPTELVPDLNDQMGKLIGTISEPHFSVQGNQVFQVRGTARAADGQLITCLEHIAFIDQSVIDDSYFFVGCWQRVDNQSKEKNENGAKDISDLLGAIKGIYFELYPERLTDFGNKVTGKEKEVLQLISLGLTTKEIANKLNISFHTVESHRKNLIRKFHARNSVELLAKAKGLS